MEIKETQGSKKMKQYLEDLRRNKYFRKYINKYLKYAKEDRGNSSDDITALLHRYIELGKVAKKILKKNKRDQTSIILKVAEKYSVDNDLFSYVYFPLITNNLMDSSPNAQIDMCYANDNYDENLGIFDHFNQLLPLIMKPMDMAHITAYPASIDIHKFATKRDVLNYVEKNWRLIECILSGYRDKNVKIRKRKYNRKMLDFIWDNRDNDVEQIKKLLDNKFPKNGLVYYEIYKFINIERRRRMKEITVGQ